MDILAYILARKKAASYTDTKVETLSGGFNYRGSVNTKADLPTTASAGDLYTVTNDGDNNGSYV